MGLLNLSTIKLVKGGVISGDNKGTGSLTSASDTEYTFGGSSDLWGLSLSSSDVNASDFGIVLSMSGSGYTTNRTSNYLEVTNFGLSVPSGATILGVEAKFEIGYQTIGSSQEPLVDHVQIKVYYTGGSSSVVQDPIGMGMFPFPR